MLNCEAVGFTLDILGADLVELSSSTPNISLVLDCLSVFTCSSLSPYICFAFSAS